MGMHRPSLPSLRTPPESAKNATLHAPSLLLHALCCYRQMLWYKSQHNMTMTHMHANNKSQHNTAMTHMHAIHSASLACTSGVGRKCSSSIRPAVGLNPAAASSEVMRTATTWESGACMGVEGVGTACVIAASEMQKLVWNRLAARVCRAKHK